MTIVKAKKNCGGKYHKEQQQQINGERHGEQEKVFVETGKLCLSMIDNIMMYYRKITNILIHINLIHFWGRY
jgi:hypothetical protein